MAFERSVSKLGFVDVEERHAPVAFGRRPASLYEIQAAANELGIDIFFEPQYPFTLENTGDTIQVLNEGSAGPSGATNDIVVTILGDKDA